MYSPCKYLKCHVLFNSVKSNLPPFSPIKATPPLRFCHPLFMSRAPTICEILFPPTFHAPPQPFSQEDTRHCSTDCEFVFPQ